jgi:formiminotetrahydrofolate cyclodeaminase
MNLVDRSIRDLVAMTARTSPAVGGSTAALLSSLLGIAMCKMALLVSAKQRPHCDLIVTRLDAIAMNITLVIDRDQASVQNLIATLKKDVGSDDRCSALIDATRQPLAGCQLLLDAVESMANVSGEIDPSVTSDYFGGVEIVAASFRAAMMAVEQNLKADLMAETERCTASGLAALLARFERTAGDLRREIRS